MPLQIKILTTAKDTIITLFNNQQNQSFTFIIVGEPTGFIFDPNNFILEDSFIEDPFNLDIPKNFTILQNFPNPFNSTTKIRFQTSARENVVIKIFDLLGNEIETIFTQEIESGIHSINFNASTLASGVYFYRMYAGDFIGNKKMILIK